MTQRTKPFALVLCSLSLMSVAASAQDQASLPLGGAFTNSGTGDEAAVRAAAQTQITAKDTRFKSTEKENKVFEGLFIPSSNATKLAVVSDDGVTITVDGAATGVANFSKGQDDQKFDEVFKVLNTSFEAGKSYKIKIDYSNTIQQGLNDFDGLTLFAFAGGGRTQEVNLIISRGQDGSAVPDDDEETIGSFTVANLNDTDSDTTVDNSDNDVPGEKDLMKLEISRPAGAATDKATVKITGGSARLWQTATKGTAVPLVNGAAEFTLGSLPKIIYLEATTTSPTLRSISVELDSKGNKDTVKATGVWAQVGAVAYATQSANSVLARPEWSDLANPPKDLLILRGGTGLLDINPSNGIGNGILMQFSVLPTGVQDVSNVKFDVSRQIRVKIWRDTVDPPVSIDVDIPFPASDEAANDDDADNGDESEGAQSNGKIYSWDAPGLETDQVDPPDSAALRFYLNAKEFVRVSFDGKEPLGDGVSGSRCSLPYLWHVKHRLVAAPIATPIWVCTTTGNNQPLDNEVGPGHIIIGVTP